MEAQSPSGRQSKSRGTPGRRSARQFPWTREEDALLGKLTDREVAEKLNRTLGGVRDRRKFLGKARLDGRRSPFVWNVSRATVTRGCSPPNQGRNCGRFLVGVTSGLTRGFANWEGKVRKLQPEWTLEEDHLLGKKPDQVLARKFGPRVSAVRHRDKMQLGLQALILCDNGYTCNEGVIYYRATKQRVRLPITPELENWILQNIAEAMRVITGPIPAPLVHSPKCVRCSLAPVCLPDETRMLAQTTLKVDVSVGEKTGAEPLEDFQRPTGEAPRRLIAARDDTRPLYLNTPGYRVGCKGEVLQVKDKDKLIEEVRMRDVSHVALFGSIQVSTQAIQSLCEQEVPVTYFSKGGWFYGITRGHAMKNVFLRMEQFRLARDETTCLSGAVRFTAWPARERRRVEAQPQSVPRPRNRARVSAKSARL